MGLGKNEQKALARLPSAQRMIAPKNCFSWSQTVTTDLPNEPILADDEPEQGSALLQLLESFPDQPLKFLRLSGVILHLLLSKTGLKCQNLLEILCLGDLFDQRER
jgi:hypothetical protein